MKVYNYAGITSAKKANFGCSLGANTAELKGVSEDQIRCTGRWDQEQIVDSYLNSLPRKFMRTLAGHFPQMGCFEIRRASVAPPAELLSMIWPQLDGWTDRFGPDTGQINDLAAMGLTNLLFYLREVILQDSVALRQQFPNSPAWNHPVFQHPSYEKFAQRMQALVGDEQQPPSQMAVLAQAIPGFSEYLCSVARSEARVERLEASFDRLEATVDRLIEEVQQAQSAQPLLQALDQLRFRFEPAPQLQLKLPLSAPAAAGARACACACIHEQLRVASSQPCPQSHAEPLPVVARAARRGEASEASHVSRGQVGRGALARMDGRDTRPALDRLARQQVGEQLEGGPGERAAVVLAEARDYQGGSADRAVASGHGGVRHEDAARTAGGNGHLAGPAVQAAAVGAENSGSVLYDVKSENYWDCIISRLQTVDVNQYESVWLFS